MPYNNYALQFLYKTATSYYIQENTNMPATKRVDAPQRSELEENGNYNKNQTEIKNTWKSREARVGDENLHQGPKNHAQTELWLKRTESEYLQVANERTSVAYNF